MRRLALLARLARLEREELDRRRADLAALEARSTDLEQRREALRRGMAAEIRTGWELDGGPAPLGRWLAAAADRDRALAREIEDLATRLEGAALALRAQHTAARRQELLLERAVRQKAAAETERERKQLDELAALRHGRSLQLLRPRTRGRGSPPARRAPA